MASQQSLGDCWDTGTRAQLRNGKRREKRRSALDGRVVTHASAELDPMIVFPSAPAQCATVQWPQRVRRHCAGGGPRQVRRVCFERHRRRPPPGGTPGSGPHARAPAARLRLCDRARAAGRPADSAGVALSALKVLFCGNCAVTLPRATGARACVAAACICSLDLMAAAGSAAGCADNTCRCNVVSTQRGAMAPRQSSANLSEAVRVFKRWRSEAMSCLLQQRLSAAAPDSEQQQAAVSAVAARDAFNWCAAPGSLLPCASCK